MDQSIYLNNAATSFPKPEKVKTAVLKYLDSVPHHHSRAGFSHATEDLVSACRKKLAELFNAPKPDNISFSSGSTESLNLAIYGISPSDSHIITTSIEHNSVLRPLMTLERDGEIELSIIDCDCTGMVNPSQIKKHIKPNTKAVVVNHCSNVTGAITDLDAISAITSSKNILLIVDASQSAGSIPIDVVKSGIDIMAFTGHKSLYGLPGIGGLYIREGLKLKPLKVGGTGVRSDLLFQPESIPMLYEAGTMNMPGLVSLKTGVEFVLETGIEKINSVKRILFEKIIEELKTIDNMILYGSNAPGATLLSFNLKDRLPEDVGYILEESFGIIIRSGLHCAPLIHKALGSYPKGSIRVSPSFFSTVREIEFFISAIRQLAGVSRK